MPPNLNSNGHLTIPTNDTSVTLTNVTSNGNAEVTGSNPVEALIFFKLLLSNCFNWKIYCDDHSSLSSTTTVRK